MLSFMSLSINLIMMPNKKGELCLVLQGRKYAKFAQRGCTQTSKITRRCNRFDVAEGFPLECQEPSKCQ